MNKNNGKDEKDEKDEKGNGLELPNQIIQKINGPVSMYYLKPKKNIWDKYKKEGVELPLLLLWGDIHQYRTGMCENCSCNIDNESKNNCCVALHDDRFLKELDKLAKFTPVDFYTEFSKDMISYVGHHGDILFGDFIEKTTKHCYDVSLRSMNEYTKRCPTKNIRWHYVDSRFMKDMIEGYILNPIRTWIDFQINRLSKKPSSSFPSTLGNVLYDRGDYDPYDPYDPDNFFSYSLPINKSLISLLCDSDNIETFTSSFTDQVIDALVMYRGKRKSAIFKQLDRISFRKLTDIDVWKDWMISNLLQMPIYRDKFQTFQNFPKETHIAIKEFILSNMTYEILNSPNSNGKESPYFKLIPALQAFNKVILIAQTKIMDLYFVGRLLKSPENDITGTLALGFFGDYHTRSIVDLLSQPIFGYDVTTIQSTDLVEYNDPRINRCVTIQIPIPLVQDVMAHHQRRISKQNNWWRIKRYTNKLQEEEKKREQNKIKTKIAREKMKNSIGDFFSSIGISKKGGKTKRTHRIRHTRYTRSKKNDNNNKKYR